MNILVTGTLAVDHIAPVVDGFNPGELNGKLGPTDTHWGGCGMNLAYGLARAEASPLPWVFYGDDCPAEYLQHIHSLGIDTTLMQQQASARCAAAYIFTRADSSQLTGFFPGTTCFEPPVAAARQQISAAPHWIAGPEDDATLLARLQYIAPTTELFWMPGQYAEVTQTSLLTQMLARRPHLIVNETEWQTLVQRLGQRTLDTATQAVFITQGGEGVRYRLSVDADWQLQRTEPANVVDPTGCGDAFCATLVAGLTQLNSMNDPVVRGVLERAQQQAARCLTMTGAQHY